MRKPLKVILPVLGLLLVAGAFIFLRGSYVSDILRATIVPKIEAAIGQKIDIEGIHLNLFPTFIEATGITSASDDGRLNFSAGSVKAYLSIESILEPQVSVDRLVMKKPVLNADFKTINKLFKRMDKDGSKTNGLSSLKAVVIRQGRIVITNATAGNKTVTATGIDIEAAIKDSPIVMIKINELTGLSIRGHLITASVGGTAVLGRQGVDISNLELKAHGATLDVSGKYTLRKGGTLRLDLNLPVASLKKMLKLKSPAYGSVRARGEVVLAAKIKDSSVDFNIDADMYIQTLMEALGVKPRNRRLTGPFSASGSLSGPVLNLEGQGRARVTESVMYGVQVDEGLTDVVYKDGMLYFKNADVKLYGGTGKVDVSFPLPKPKPYTVSVKFSDIDSPEVLKLIKIDWLNIPYGKINGNLYSHGDRFEPAGRVDYEVRRPADDAIGRVQTISTGFSTHDKVTTLAGLKATSESSTLLFSGNVDRRARTLNFNGRLITSDVTALTLPHYDKLKGAGEFTGTVTGPYDNPLVAGDVMMFGAVLGDYAIGDIKARAKYTKNLLTVTSATAKNNGITHTADGTIAFPNAKRLLQLSDPVYDIKAAFNKAELKSLLEAHNARLPLEGTFDADINIKGGRYPYYSGSAVITELRAYGTTVERAGLEFAYNFDTFKIINATLSQGQSVIGLNGQVDKRGVFEFIADSGKFFLSDFTQYDLPLSYRMGFKAEGHGTVDKPRVTVTADLTEGRFRELPLGDGTLRVVLKGRNLEYNASLLDGKVGIDGNVRLEDRKPWSAEVTFKPGRYDFLINPYLKEVPEDMLLNIMGRASLKGDSEHMSARVLLERINLTLYEHSLSSASDIEVLIDDKKLTFPGFKLLGANASLNVRGSVELEKSYNLVVEGQTSLRPLKAFSERIDDVRGTSKFAISVTGDWDRPLLSGGLEIKDGSLALKDVAQRLSAINGYSYFDNDTIDIQRLSAKLGGGDVVISGVIRLDGLSIGRVNMEMLLSNVNVSPSPGFNANLGGNIIIVRADDSVLITGDVTINSASYRDNIEYKSWIVKLKRAEAVAAKAKWTDNVKLGVKIYGDRDIEVENNMARAELKVDLLLRGTLGSPLLLGRLESAEGKVFFRNAEFRILNATAYFSDTSTREPYVDIVAETSVKGYQIWLTLEGKPEQMDMTLVSDPELKTVEILSLLTIGEFGERVEGLEGGIGAAEATSMLTSGVQSIVQERLRDLTGISRFQVNPYVSRETGTVTPRVTVSKKIAGDKMFVTYSSSIGTSAEQEIQLEYRINKSVSLLGGRNDLGIVGGDVQFRFRYK